MLAHRFHHQSLVVLWIVFTTALQIVFTNPRINVPATASVGKQQSPNMLIPSFWRFRKQRAKNKKISYPSWSCWKNSSSFSILVNHTKVDRNIFSMFLTSCMFISVHFFFPASTPANQSHCTRLTKCTHAAASVTDKPERTGIHGIFTNNNNLQSTCLH